MRENIYDFVSTYHHRHHKMAIIDSKTKRESWRAIGDEIPGCKIGDVMLRG